VTGLSNTRVDKRGGDVLRKFRTDGSADPHDLVEAFAILRQFRETFQYPLTKANMGLRSCVRTATRTDPACTQRLKQPLRIIDKLTRKPTMRLSQMEDVGGCRSVLPDLDAVYRVANRIRGTGRVLYEDDANTYERSTGYRALHLITEYDDRKIEIQLRTPRQQEWAEHVEELDDLLGTRLKDGDGPDELSNYLKALSDGIAQLDKTGTLDEHWNEGYVPVRERAEDYIRMAKGGRDDDR
jgi:putative GTP pyrophosphokinase